MASTKKKTALGYLGPAIVLIGIAASAVAIWYMRSVRPVAGDVIDTIAIDETHSFVVRTDATDSHRSFLELRERDEVKWQALIPHYAGAPGRPAIAWSPNIVTVRVERDGRAEIFAFAMSTAAKVGALRLAPEHEPITTQTAGPITLTDHKLGFEIYGGAGWNQVVAIDLDTGKGTWKTDLGPEPVTAGGIEGGKLSLVQGAKRKLFDLTTGRVTE